MRSISNGARIFVGLSGGVDSAVSAVLLKNAGAEVTGVFIKGWYPPEMPCTWAEERRDAMRVAARLHIPFRTLDASVEYKKGVIDYLLAEYRAGRTPNTDVMCNREVKFGAFYRFAKAQGADAIATGHYRSGGKDQSYFLWAVPKDILDTVIFPVGNMEKDEVRALAKKYNLPVAEKKDSQGICFLGSVSVEEFLKKELGDDNPALLYTIGQRIEGGYVVGKDVEKKEIKIAKTLMRIGSVSPHRRPKRSIAIAARVCAGALKETFSSVLIRSPIFPLPANRSSSTATANSSGVVL
ncbi:MAG: tRNA-specific 2-thiouridylase MnmA [Parcubacteria group bacterium GW2011_GWA1_54_9]|nr:MAG: tRNA-specific 2-thiouridylase MnmA [Parcubacteria group bacterium GW2011_GWA1_54_9]